MFCPNCASKNAVGQNYCRGCGLKLDAIAEAVSDQFPSSEYIESQRRRQRFERIGLLCLSISGIIGFSFLIFLAIQYKLIFLGPEILFGSAIGTLIVFLLLSVFFFNYPRLFMTTKVVKQKEKPSDVITAKLIEDRPFESASSVIEETTNLLEVPKSRTKN